MARKGNREHVLPQAEDALDRFKYEVAEELGIRLDPDYNGDMTAREAGTIGGHMVRRMIGFARRNLAQSEQGENR